MTKAGTSPREDYLAAGGRWFRPTGSVPARKLFRAPQYNTWIDNPCAPTRHPVTEYAFSRPPPPA